MFNKIGPNMEHCGTPDNRILKTFSPSFNLTSFSLSKNIKMLKLQWLIHTLEVLQ